MAEESKTTQALLRALLREMEKSLSQPKPVAEGQTYYLPPGHRTRVNVKEFERGQEEGESWWKDGGDEDTFIGLRPRHKPAPKPRAKRRLR